VLIFEGSGCFKVVLAQKIFHKPVTTEIKQARKINVKERIIDCERKRDIIEGE